jgi:pilus assembly protein Flp/PilA
MRMKQLLQRLMREQSGQDLIEYALIAGLIGLGSVVAMGNMQHSIGNLFNAVSSRLANMT